MQCPNSILIHSSALIQELSLYNPKVYNQVASKLLTITRSPDVLFNSR